MSLSNVGRNSSSSCSIAPFTGPKAICDVVGLGVGSVVGPEYPPDIIVARRVDRKSELIA